MYKSLQDFLNKNQQDNLPYTPIEQTDDNSLMSTEDYSNLISQDPTLLQSAKPPKDYMQKALEESNDTSIPGIIPPQVQTKSQDQTPTTSTSSIDKPQANISTPDKETDLQRLEKKLQELRDTDLERQQTASKYNFGTKAAAIIGDALSKYQTGAIQKNVASPVQFTGPSLQQMMSMIGEVKAPSSTEQRQALIDRYKEIKADQKAQNASKEAKDAAELKYKRDLAMLDKTLQSKERIADKKALEPSFEEKLAMKTKADEDKLIAKENRAIKEKLQPVISTLDSQIANVDRALKLFKDPKTGKIKGGLTGPIRQYISPITPEGQKIENALNKISLSEMTKTFAGMSKAVDSDAERAFFQAAQPSLKKYEDVNVEVLEEMKTNLESLRDKSKAKLQEIEVPKQNEAIYGEFVERDGKSYRWNPSVNKYQLIPSK
jgi:hypothetical protein